MNKFLFFFLSFFLQQPSTIGQVEFHQPLGGQLKVTGTFCEFRSNHFHGGLDFRTPVGAPVYAIADGYISRINVSTGGYGNALYITHYNGYKSVYGHLNRFIPNITTWFTEKQVQSQCFALDLELDSNIFPVKKGDIIAYSGNTGYSFGPHLHFEIRNLKDEPLNPQAFNYYIKDTKAPRISKIAVYPAKSDSYVNNHNYSSVFAVKYGKISNKIYVHGDVYFGIEAFDYLNLVSSRNIYYSTKLYVDDELIYFSQFDKFSYPNGRDINSMVDYKRRKLKGWRIQKCYVEPNNELFHYKNVINNGIVNFSDDKTHRIKFVVSDMYGNKSSINFTVISVSKKKAFQKEKEYSKILKYDTENEFKAPGIELFFPKKSLFNNVAFLFFTSVGNKFSPIFHIGSEFTPLKKHMVISLSTTGVPEKYKDKSIICYIDYKKEKDYIKGNLEDDYLSASVKEFGKYFVDVDIIPPKIIPVNISLNKTMLRYGEIKIKMFDDKSGINNWAIFINDEWVLSSYSSKNKILTYKFDDKTKKGKNKFLLIVSDNVRNYSTYKTYFYR